VTSSNIAQEKDRIKADIAAHKVILYMKGSKSMPMCGFSGQVVHLLNGLNVPYETRNVLENETLRQAIKEFSDWPTIPQLYINGEFIGGCDIITELHQTGELQRLLG
jgi:monothiol glutaredoxin